MAIRSRWEGGVVWYLAVAIFRVSCVVCCDVEEDITPNLLDEFIDLFLHGRVVYFWRV